MKRVLPVLAVVAVLWAPAVTVAEPIAMTTQELAEERGGIATPMGLDIGFGATMNTFIDGQLALSTKLVWTDQGALVERSGSLADVAALADAQLAPITAAVAGVAGGSTQVIQDISAGRIANVVLNTASDRTIRQDTNITLTLPQLPELQQQFNAAAMSASLQSALGLALQNSARSAR